MVEWKDSLERANAQLSEAYSEVEDRARASGVNEGIQYALELLDYPQAVINMVVNARDRGDDATPILAAYRAGLESG